jgi:dolichol-phosphate mannosyltransferase
MDSDLQHPPELIPELLKKHEEGYEIVYTIRSGTEREGYLRRLCGSLFYHSFRRLTNVDLKAGTADFRLIGSKATSALRQFRERHLFLRGIIGWIGFRQTSVCYRAGPRVRGRSKYDLRRKVSLAFDALFSFSYFPMRLVAGIGLLFDLLAFLYAAYIVYYRFTRPELVPGWASMMVVILFLAGLLLLTLGVFGEYLGRIYEEVKGRPLYVIESAIGFQETDDSNGKANSACRE